MIGVMVVNMQTPMPISSGTRSVSFIARVVGEGCNLKCGYCWFRNHDQSHPVMISEKVIEKIDY